MSQNGENITIFSNTFTKKTLTRIIDDLNLNDHCTCMIIDFVLNGVSQVDRLKCLILMYQI